MKTKFLLLALIMSGCTTVTRPDGSRQSVMTPQGAQVVSGLVGTGVGALTGWAVTGTAKGALAGGLGAGAGQLVGGFAGGLIPTSAPQPSYNPNLTTDLQRSGLIGR